MFQRNCVCWKGTTEWNTIIKNIHNSTHIWSNNVHILQYQLFVRVHYCDQYFSQILLVTKSICGQNTRLGFSFSFSWPRSGFGKQRHRSLALACLRLKFFILVYFWCWNSNRVVLCFSFFFNNKTFMEKICQNVNLRSVSLGCVYSIVLGMKRIHHHNYVSYRYVTHTILWYQKKRNDLDLYDLHINSPDLWICEGFKRL